MGIHEPPATTYSYIIVHARKAKRLKQPLQEGIRLLDLRLSDRHSTLCPGCIILCSVIAFMPVAHALNYPQNLLNFLSTKVAMRLSYFEIAGVVQLTREIRPIHRDSLMVFYISSRQLMAENPDSGG
jgi:hypothetical protein